MTNSLFLNALVEHRQLLDGLHVLDQAIGHASESMAACLSKGGKLMLCGNGGSAADCQHLAAELTGRLVRDRRPLAALALTTDTSALTCIANDYDFQQVFARQVVALGRPGDVLLGISTSGRSENVLRAVQAAGELGMVTVGLLGRDGGPLRELCDISIVVPSQTTARIQEMHILIGHTMCAQIEAALGLDGS